MKNVLRALLGVLAGLVTALALIATFEAIGRRIWPLPPGVVEPKDAAELAALMRQLPWPAQAHVVFCWLVGAAGGSWIALRLSGTQQGVKAALGVGGAIWLATGAPLIEAAFPVWMKLAGLFGVPLAVALVLLLGRRASAELADPPPGQ